MSRRTTPIPTATNARLTVVSSTAPTLGTAVRRDNTITFTAGQVLGDTRINYQVADETGAVSLGQLVVQIVERQNRPPVAAAETRNIFGPGVPTAIDVLDNAFDPDGAAGEADRRARQRHEHSRATARRCSAAAS